tara:strand:+ start:12418 stop:13248 length:831 start_codon:yes stop_codon:yes gene_type:complete
MDMISEAQLKFDGLISKLDSYVREGLLVAFSGGVDSSFLLWAASEAHKRTGGRLLAITTTSPSVPQRDIDDALSFAKRIGVECELVESEEFKNERYVRNDRMRCYFCKSELFRISDSIIRDRNFQYVAYGYTASDKSDIRPGHQAAKEHKVLYPLAEFGFTKDEIRKSLRQNGYEIGEKPASPCLSSRVMTGVSITPMMLKDIEELENLLFDRGLKCFRVRHHDDGESRFIRLEVVPTEMERALELKEILVKEAKMRGYRWVTLDLEGYRTGGANR